MPPKAKKIAADSQKQPRTKTKSDEIYNARRRAKRALEKVQRKQNENPTEAGQRTISQMQQLIENSYAETKGKKRGQYKFEEQSLERSLNIAAKSATRKERRERNERKNTLFERDLSLSRNTEVEGTRFEPYEVNIFYTATKQFWEGKPQSARNKAIMDALKVETLEEAWNIVFENEAVKEALRRAEQAQQPAETDGDISDGEFEPPDEAGSPPYIEYLVNVISTR